MSLISDVCDEYFEQKGRDFLKMPKLSVFLCRGDGLVIFQHGDISKEDFICVGALIGGTWQASYKLSSYLDDQMREEDFKLDFSSHDSGFYLLPVNYKKDSFYLGMIYNQEMNPAKLKNKFRIARDHLVQLLQERKSDEINKDVKNVDYTKEGFLFKNITDDEMDKLFSFSGC